jgi:hypothetical protein
MAKDLSHDRIARVARMYKTNTDASKVLRMDSTAFRDLCRRLGIETPLERKRARMQ